MILNSGAAAAGSAKGGTTLLDDGRTLASYGIAGSDNYDDIATLNMVVVAPLTPEQIEARRKEVYDAAKHGDAMRCQRAIQAAKDGGADLNWQSHREWGHTPVNTAARMGNNSCLAQLIDAGANITIPDTFGRTPVYTAAWIGNNQCLAQLIKAGANINTGTTEEGQTPLQIAIADGEEEAAALLRAAGAK